LLLRTLAATLGIPEWECLVVLEWECLVVLE
jgi:hypothetical protein